MTALADGNMPAAFPLAHRIAKDNRNSGLAHLVLGVEAIKEHNFARARAELAKGGQDRRHHIVATLLTAWTYADDTAWGRALSVVDKLSDDSHKILRDYHAALIAGLGTSSKDAAESERRFKTAYSAEKNTLRLVDAYARFLASHGQREEAKRIYTLFDEAAPGHPLVLAALADLDAGKSVFPFVRNVDQGAAEALYGFGSIVHNVGSDDLTSLIYLRLSLYLAPENTLATVTLGDVYERMKQEETYPFAEGRLF